MTEVRRQGSLLERAATVYDFDAVFRARQGSVPVPSVLTPAVDPAPTVGGTTPHRPVTAAVPRTSRHQVALDRALLAEQGLLVPGAPVSALAEEFRLIKRQLLLNMRQIAPVLADRSRTILICSANPGDGKTQCALNLALSLAAERDTRVLLIDGDLAKPDVMKRLGLGEGRGLLDALADPTIAVEDLVVGTDVPQLSLLPAGTRTNHDTELLASGETARLLDALLAADPRRIILFDSPPALAASPAATLAQQLGQVMLVVRADKTSDSDLREAVGLLDGCDTISLVLNAVTFNPGGRRFGSYYEVEDA